MAGKQISLWKGRLLQFGALILPGWGSVSQRKGSGLGRGRDTLSSIPSPPRGKSSPRTAPTHGWACDGSYTTDLYFT